MALCLYVCLSVCPSQAGALSKQIELFCLGTEDTPILLYIVLKDNSGFSKNKGNSLWKKYFSTALRRRKCFQLKPRPH